MRAWPGYLALPLAAGALAVALLKEGAPNDRTPVAASPASVGACVCDTATLSATVDRLEAEVARLRVERDRGSATPPEVAAPDEVRKPAVAARSTPALRYRRLTPPVRALQIEQNENGSLRVRNADPALTGQIFEVQAETADGSTRTIRVTAPPPE